MSIDVTIKHLTGTRQGTVETIRGLPLWFGRSEKCQVRFDPDADVDRRVSAVHAELREGDDGGVSIFDLGSKNGVYLNGTKVEEQAEVPDRATIQLGNGGPRLQLSFEEGGGIDFKRVRKKTERRLDKNKVESRPLATTDSGFPAFTEADLASTRQRKSWVEEHAPVLGAAVAVIVILLAMVSYFLR